MNALSPYLINLVVLDFIFIINLLIGWDIMDNKEKYLKVLNIIRGLIIFNFIAILFVAFVLPGERGTSGLETSPTVLEFTPVPSEIESTEPVTPEPTSSETATAVPTEDPTEAPTVASTEAPTAAPTNTPKQQPTNTPRPTATKSVIKTPTKRPPTPTKKPPAKRPPTPTKKPSTPTKPPTPTKKPPTPTKGIRF